LLKSFKSRLENYLAHIRVYGLYSLYKRGYLFEMGWFESFRTKEAIDRQGQPIPWITYPCLTFLAGRIDPGLTVFEYGCGNSTLWWAERVAKVVSCEHDRPWYEHVVPLIPANVELKHVPLVYGGEYCQQVAKYQDEFDVVFIDGRDRVNCAKHALAALKTGGVVIFDNSDLSDYEEARQFLHAHGYRRIDFVGPGPITYATWQTSIFYKDNNCLGI
jgi:tRNA A58 N-methylase Trm61